VFATGFFPYKPFLAGLATHEQLLAEEELGLLGESGAEITRPARVFDKVIFMVVDALRRYVACRDEECEQWRVSKWSTIDLGARRDRRQAYTRECNVKEERAYREAMGVGAVDSEDCESRR